MMHWLKTWTYPESRGETESLNRIPYPLWNKTSGPSLIVSAIEEWVVPVIELLFSFWTKLLYLYPLTGYWRKSAPLTDLLKKANSKWECICRPSSTSAITRDVSYFFTDANSHYDGTRTLEQSSYKILRSDGCLWPLKLLDNQSLLLHHQQELLRVQFLWLSMPVM